MFEKLSPRQKEVASGLLRGNTIQETAEDLGISPYTAKVHQNFLYRKLDVHSRSQLFKLAVEHGVLKFTPKYEKGK